MKAERNSGSAGRPASSAARTASATQRARCASVKGLRAVPRCPAGPRVRRRLRPARPPPAAGTRAPWWRTAARAGHRRARAFRTAAGSAGSARAGRRPTRTGSARRRGPGRGTPRTSACRCRTACSASGRTGRAHSAPGTSPRPGARPRPSRRSGRSRRSPGRGRPGSPRSRPPADRASRPGRAPPSPSKARLSAPDGQSRTARTISSIRPPLGATKGSASVRNAVGSRSVHRPECWQMPRLSKIVTCCPG